MKDKQAKETDKIIKLNLTGIDPLVVVSGAKVVTGELVEGDLVVEL
jgi:hypothetical protein